LEQIGFWIAGIVVICVLAISILPIALSHARRQNELERDCFQELARRLRGRFEEARMSDERVVHFAHRGSSGALDTFSTGGALLHTRVRIDLPSAEARCEVFPQAVYRVGKLLGMIDFEIGVPEFDHDYIISGTNQERVKQLLTPEARAVLNRVRARAERGDMYFSIKGFELLLRRRGFTPDAAELERFVQCARALYDAVVDGGAGGIEFVDGLSLDADAVVMATVVATCQVCGEQITVDPVLCNRCRTPHHHDCWEYYGQCSTYGCRERGYFRPRRQAPPKGRK
jgi:hypothetical protein